VPVSVLVCNYMYLQTDVDIRSMVPKLTNGGYDKQSKQNVLLYIIYSYQIQLHLDLVTQILSWQ